LPVLRCVGVGNETEIVNYMDGSWDIVNADLNDPVKD
jgi:hypothetical protein